MRRVPEAPSPFVRLREAAAAGPVVVAHRGDSEHEAENTLAAFAAARALGVVMQEFDVQPTRDGVWVCLHDATLDRTTDAAQRLGPGALLAQTTSAELAALDASAWHGRGRGGERIPTLRAALEVMLPACIPMIEHKAGAPHALVATLRAARVERQCIVQSFDWDFVAAVHALAPEIALAVLGPNERHAHPDAAAVAAARALGAGMLHWQDRALGRADVTRAHGAGLLVCSYTTDDALGWSGGRAIGIDAMCTNRPASARTW